MNHLIDDDHYNFNQCSKEFGVVYMQIKCDLDTEY